MRDRVKCELAFTSPKRVYWKGWRCKNYATRRIAVCGKEFNACLYHANRALKELNAKRVAFTIEDIFRNPATPKVPDVVEQKTESLNG